MEDKLKKTLQDIVRNNARNKSDISGMISVLLDEYVKKTGTPYIALIYPPSAFNSDGQLKRPVQEIKPLIAASIRTACKRRAEIALEYKVMMEQEALKNGFITCA